MLNQLSHVGAPKTDFSKSFIYFEKRERERQSKSKGEAEREDSKQEWSLAWGLNS